MLQPLLARDVVRYVGEPVALVVAEDPWTAEDAAELVELDLDPLPGRRRSRRRPRQAERRSCTSTSASNVVNMLPTALRRRRRPRPPPRTWSFGGVSRCSGTRRADGDARSRRRATTRARAAHGLGRGEGEALQPRGRSPRCSGSSASAVRLVEVDVGGGFGVRGELYPGGRPRPVRRAAPRPPGEVDRGSRGAPRRDEPLARAGARDRGRRDRGRPLLALRGSLLVRPGRVRADTGHPAGAPSGPPPARAVPLGRVLGRRPRGAHEPHARRHVPRPGDDGGDVRARAHARRPRRRARRSTPPSCAGATS